MHSSNAQQECTLRQRVPGSFLSSGLRSNPRPATTAVAMSGYMVFGSRSSWICSFCSRRSCHECQHEVDRFFNFVHRFVRRFFQVCRWLSTSFAKEIVAIQRIGHGAILYRPWSEANLLVIHQHKTKISRTIHNSAFIQSFVAFWYRDTIISAFGFDWSISWNPQRDVKHQKIIVCRISIALNYEVSLLSYPVLLSKFYPFSFSFFSFFLNVYCYYRA